MNLHLLRNGSAIVALSFGSFLHAQSTNRPSPPGSEYPDTQSNATPSSSDDQKSDTQHMGNTPSTPSDTTSTATTSDSTVAASSDQTQSSSMTLQVASAGAPMAPGQNLVGQTVRSSDGQKIGEVKALLLDAQTRQARFAVVSGTGVFGFGTALRLIPFEAFNQNSATQSSGSTSNSAMAAPGASNGITVAMHRSQWDQLPRVTDQDLQQGTVTLNGQQQQEVAQVFGTTFSDQTANVATNAPSTATTGTATTTPSAGPPPFFRAPSFASSSSAGTASANAESSASSSAGTTAVGNSSASTGFAANATSSSSSISPTGQTSAQQNPIAGAALVTATRAVREALDRDPSLARLNVRVEPQNGRIVLHGTVPTPNDKSAVDAAAEQAAQGFQVDSELGVGQEEP